MSDGAADGYSALKNRAQEAFRSGRLQHGLDLLDEGLALARRSGEPGLVDLALCNRAAVAIELRRTDGIKTELRRILLANADPKNAFLAAYHLGRAYEVDKDLDKAMFYARIARRRAQELANSERLAQSHMQLGNLLVGSSDFEEAETELRQALELLPEAPSIRRALVMENLGYCHVVQGRHQVGFRHHFAALRMLRRLGGRVYEAHPHVSLCFAYLEIHRYRHAIRHGETGLRLAEEAENAEQIKTALFLLGQAYKQAGDPLTAHRHFQRLQEEYYPEAAGVPDLLLFVNVMNVVNIKA